MASLYVVQEVYSKPRTPVDFASLSFENKVFLGAICRALLKENLYEIAPSKLYLEKGISKKHAANSVIGACERYAERAKINGWDLTQYNRIKDLPQSVLSLFYFNRVLGIGEMGFRVPPTIV
ncbi:MAG: hypothetical protein E7E26_13245 [Clostridiales bacterium]|nr:hypothetical protein [Clostridiales bacterium]